MNTTILGGPQNRLHIQSEPTGLITTWCFAQLPSDWTGEKTPPGRCDTGPAGHGEPIQIGLTTSSFAQYSAAPGPRIGSR